jgi:hypothetical protein
MSGNREGNRYRTTEVGHQFQTIDDAKSPPRPISVQIWEGSGSLVAITFRDISGIHASEKTAFI